ncbi:MAG: sugar-binding domain-containing protein [Fibrobacteraceae bacterium]
MNSIVSLNGEWDLLWDKDDAGMLNRWYATNPGNCEKVQVPHVWEHSVEKMTLTQDTAYYFKHFHVDGKQVPKRIFLKFDRIAMHATFWLNGKLLGTHFGAYSPCILDTSKAIKVGEDNVICVRVANMGSANSRIDFGRESKEGADDRYVHPTEMPVGLPWQQYPFGGICGNVSLILGNTAFISGIQLEPDMDEERVAVEVAFNNPRGFQARLEIYMKNPMGQVSKLEKEIKLERENATQRFLLGIKDWKKDKFVWSPESPNLFAIELQLKAKVGKGGKDNEETLYSVVRNFGFRKIDCIKGDFYVNDAIAKVQGVRYTQHWSEGGLWNPDKAILRKDLEAVKKAGFNFIRSGGAPLSSDALDICDELGLIVLQELPIHTMRSSNRGLEIIRSLTEDIIREQKHHPCIAAWVLGAENGALVLENGNKLLKHVDQLDKCRPVISNLNCVYLDDEETFRKDTGKLMGVTNDRILLYASHRMHLRMTPNASLTYFLSHYCDKEAQDISVPDSALGDTAFQDDYESFVNDINGKILITLKNNSLFPDTPTDIKGPRSQKNSKAIKSAYKQLNAFIADKNLSVWDSFESFNADARRIALKSKLDQITAVQSNPLVSGYMLDEWADIGTDFSGIVNENRKTKGCDEFLKEITAPTRILISGFEPVNTPAGEMSFQLALLNAARLEDIEVEIAVLDKSGKTASSQKRSIKTKKEQEQKPSSLVPLGTFTVVAPKANGEYTLELRLRAAGETIHTSSEKFVVIEPVNVKDAMKQVCFLDNSAETTSDALAALSGPEKIIFTANLSVWPDEVVNKIVEVTRDGGKTLLLSDMSTEDIEAFNANSHFSETIQSHFSTGAKGLSLHYLVKDSPFLPEFGGKNVLDAMASAVMPSVSLNELPGATVLARSVTFKDGEVKTGVDLQAVPFGKGKLVFNQFSIFEWLETNALADRVFAKLIKLAQ